MTGLPGGWMAEELDSAAPEADPSKMDPGPDLAEITYDFRPVAHADLVMLARWLREPVVSAWWRDPVAQLAAIQRHLAGQGPDPLWEQLVVTADDMPIAYARLRTDKGDPVGLPQGALLIDGFAAPEGLGHGAAWLSTLGDRLLHKHIVIAAALEPGNLRAASACRAAGFVDTGMRRNAEGGLARIMTRHR